MDKETRQLINEAVLGIPQEFELGGIKMALYPATLGVSLRMGEYVSLLGFDDYDRADMQIMDTMRVCHEQKMDVARAIAINTFGNARDILDTRKVNERAELIAEHADVKDMASLLLACMLKDQGIDKLIEGTGIRKDKEDLGRISELREETGNSAFFGGRTVYGQIIDAACERYGWTFDYVLWGISLINLQMMLADKVSSVYLTDDENKRLHIVKSANVIDGDNPENAARIREMLNN